eukprot:15204842-Alexandrium_andersonii.AAC.1
MLAGAAGRTRWHEGDAHVVVDGEHLDPRSSRGRLGRNQAVLRQPGARLSEEPAVRLLGEVHR